MKVVIDTKRCSGHGRCYMHAPGLFVDDEAGFGQVIGDGEFGEEQLEAANRAVRGCPERAISIENE